MWRLGSWTDIRASPRAECRFQSQTTSRRFHPVFPCITFFHKPSRSQTYWKDAESCLPICVLAGLTPQITGGKKQSDEGAALFAFRVHLPC